jgi:hypothetical protein
MDFIKTYQSKVALQGASKSYLSAGFGFGNITYTYIAEFGQDAPKAEIRKRFDNLVNQVDKVKFGCCSFVKNDLSENESIISQAYLPFDLNGKMGKGYDKMILDVVMMKYISLDANKKDNWYLILRVYNLDGEL